MGLGDKDTRIKAIPFQATPYEPEPHAPPLTYLDGRLLIEDPTQTSDQVKVIRVSGTHLGDIVEAYLFMQMTAPSDIALSVKVGIGRFNSDGTPDNTYSYTTVEGHHQILTGTNTAFQASASAVLTAEVDLLPLIPKRGDADYYNGDFVLLVAFESLPDVANGYSLDKLIINCSAQMGLT